MNPHLSQLHAYPFEKLDQLKRGIVPPSGRSATLLSIGEPRHAPPPIVFEALEANFSSLGQYPGTRGGDALRAAIGQWLQKRFKLGKPDINPATQILPVNGTREALFAFAQCLLDQTQASDTVLIPNPFYQIYEGAALLAGLRVKLYDTPAESNYQPNFDALLDTDWQRCQLLYLCSPGNPTGAVIEQHTIKKLIELAHKHDFIIACDECYSEIYHDEASPPVGLLQVCRAVGNDTFAHCVVFHSLSKRSNLPGLRSGFVAGDAQIIEHFFRYRTYHGCSMSPMIQAASQAVWGDETHVVVNRSLYREKFDAVIPVLADTLDIQCPEAGFYLWLKLSVDDEYFTQQLFQQHNITVLPGRYLARSNADCNPGEQHVRIALVAALSDCVVSAQCIRDTLNSL